MIANNGAATFVENEGTLADTAGAASFTVINAPFSNSGSVTVQQGTLSLDAVNNTGTVMVPSGTALSANTYSQTAGNTVLDGGTLSGGTYSINAGLLTGSGTVNACVTNGGQVIPGGTVHPGSSLLMATTPKPLPVP